jgi:alanine racemase
MGAAVEATIDLRAIAHNVGVVRERSGADLMAVVKADGYGHGAVPVARTALAAGAVEVGWPRSPRRWPFAREVSPPP